MAPSDGATEAGISLDNGAIRPTSHRFVHVLRFAFEEWRCFLITFLILLCVISISWCFNLLRFYKHDDICQPVHYSLASMILLLLYLIYLFECFNCRTRLDLFSATEVNQIMPRIEAAVREDPKLWWLCFAYHYVKRRRRRCHCRPRYTEEVRFSTILENGKAAVLNSEPHDRVITSAKQHFINESAALKCVWRDKSPQIEWNQDVAVRITFVKEFIFADEATRDQYEIHKRNFMKIQESSDDFMEIKEGFQLYNEAEIQPSVLVLQQRSPLFTQAIFIVATVLLLSWPYRLLVYSRTAKLNYPFRKVLRILPTKSHRCGYKYHPRASNSNEWRNNEAFIMENPLADRDDSLLPSDSDDELLSLDIRYTGSD